MQSFRQLLKLQEYRLASLPFSLLRGALFDILYSVVHMAAPIPMVRVRLVEIDCKKRKPVWLRKQRVLLMFYT